MKKFLGIIFILAIFASIPNIASAQPMPTAPTDTGSPGIPMPQAGGTVGPAGTVDGTGVDAGSFTTETAPMPTPEMPIHCWGCTPEASTCPQTPGACQKDHDCQVECSCPHVPPNHVPIDKGRCVQIYDGQPAYQGCYCVQCGYAY